MQPRSTWRTFVFSGRDSHRRGHRSRVTPPARWGGSCPVGAVVALESQLRREPDDVLPGFIALNSGDLIGSGYLPSAYAPFKVNPSEEGLTALIHPEGAERLETRWNLIDASDTDRTVGSLGQTSLDMPGFYDQAKTCPVPEICIVFLER